MATALYWSVRAIADPAGLGSEVERQTFSNALRLDLHQAAGFPPDTGATITTATTGVLHRDLIRTVIHDQPIAGQRFVPQLNQLAAIVEAD